MRVIIAKDGKNITYQNITSIENQGDNLLLLSDTHIEIFLNGWLIAKTPSLKIEKRCLICVDEVFLDTRVEDKNENIQM